jgi:DNA-binding beta-propeller fold protein YncE
VLGAPSGLTINPKNRHLMVVAAEGGRILEIEVNGKEHVLKRGLKGLNGIDYDAEGNLYVASVEKGEVYRIPFYGRGTLTTFLSGLEAPANISCDRRRHELLVPSLTGNSVSTFPLFSGLGRRPPAGRTK